ncbi:MAG: DUF418 domain-containing protein [Saprospiraceae bacterium]|nr:DUF418 domain-containing protein [Saprospiraceae bacterium]
MENLQTSASISMPEAPSTAQPVKDKERIESLDLLRGFAMLGILLIVSPIWLKYYRFGPLEWLWRSLSYRKLQPMRR